MAKAPELTGAFSDSTRLAVKKISGLVSRVKKEESRQRTDILIYALISAIIIKMRFSTV